MNDIPYFPIAASVVCLSLAMLMRDLAPIYFGFAIGTWIGLFIVRSLR